MKKIAMVSYNTFTVDDEANGWQGQDRRLLLLQNSEEKLEPDRSKSEEEVSDEIRKEAEWKFIHLMKFLPELDLIFLYVGTYGSEWIISMAQETGLDPQKAVFVMCGCNLDHKKKLLDAFGFGNSKIVHSECGGILAMNSIYKEFMKSGEIKMPEERSD